MRVLKLANCHLKITSVLAHPSTSKTAENVERIRELIHEDRRLMIHDLADNVGISYGVCQEILTENLNTRRIAAKFVPRLLTKDQMEQRMNVCLELREIFDFSLFPKMKMKLKGRRFETVSDIQRESQKVLDSLRENDFCSAFEAWKSRLERCIRSKGNYFEGDGSQN